MLADFAADRTGFLSAELVRLPDGAWLDIVRWATPADFAAPRAKGADRPGIAAFLAAIAELVSADEGVLAGPPQQDEDVPTVVS
jgi:hypothetical protein